MRAIRSAVILLMISGSTMAASPFVDPKGLSCSDRTPPATSSPVSATRPAFSRPSPPILLFGSPLRKLQPSQRGGQTQARSQRSRLQAGASSQDAQSPIPPANPPLACRGAPNPTGTFPSGPLVGRQPNAVVLFLYFPAEQPADGGPFVIDSGDLSS